MKFYVPLKVFEMDAFKTLYASLIEAKLVKDISANLKHEHDICNTKDISIEFKHNKLIQEKYFKSEIYKGSSSTPLYIWHKDKRVHLNGFHGGLEKVRLLDVSLITTTNPEYIEGIFYIIELSFWKDFTVQQVLQWIAQHYSTLSDLNMRVIRLPDIWMSLPSLLRLGLYKDSATNALNGYYLWNGSSAEIYSQLVYTRDNTLSAQAVIKKLGPEAKKYYDDITKHISIIEPIRDKQETISEKPLTVTVNNASIYTPEAIIAKLGRKEAAALAQAILNKLLE